MSVVLTVE